MQNEKEPFEHTRQTMRMRPTLIIGAGGTGYETVVRIKARFKETFPPELLEQIRYIVFDTDTNHPPVRSSTGELVYLEPDIELFQIGGVPVKGIIENQHNYPEIAAELDLKRLPRLDLTKGAKQVRQLGRLAFFYHFQRIRKVLETALRDVLNISHYSTNSPSVQAINTFFISSACGGTGSGIVIDLAYLTRFLAQKWGIPVDYIHSTGMLYMPEAFTKIPSSNESQVRANASAMLAEIDHFMVFNDFVATYPDKTRVADTRPPFSITYIVDASNERNQTVEDLNQLTPIMAEALFLQAGSYLGAQVDSAFDNIPTSLSQDINGHLKGYSMVGASTLRFNAYRMQQACAFRLTKALVNDAFLQPLPKPGPRQFDDGIHPAVRDQVESFLGTANLTVEVMKQRLKEMSGQDQMLVNFNTEMFDKVAATAMVRKVENAGTRYAQDIINGKYLPQIERNQQYIADTAEQQLANYVYNLVDGVQSGIPTAQAFLKGLITSLTPLRRQLQEERENIKKQSARAQRDIQRAYEQFDETAQSFNFWGLYIRPIRQARQRYTEHVRRFQQQVLNQGVVNQGLSLLETIEVRAQRLMGVLLSFRAALEKVAGDADHDMNVLLTSWHPTHVTEEDIDKPENAHQFYSRYINDSIAHEGQELVTSKAMSEWFREFANVTMDEYGPTSNPEGDLSVWMRRHALHRFERIRQDESVEKQLEDEHDTERERRARLQALIGLGAPFSNYETTSAGQGSDDLDQILVVGVQDKNSSIFRDVQLRNASLVSTFDQYRISVLYTKHGLPLYALRQYSEYKKHFASHQANSSAGAVPLFGFKVVAQEAKVRAWFAQAEAFGIIGRKGATGYVARVNGHEQKLGSDLRGALQTVIADEPMHDQLWHSLVSWQEKNNHQEAMNALQDYMNQERRSPVPLHNELVLIAQSEFNRHRRLSRT